MNIKKLLSGVLALSMLSAFNGGTIIAEETDITELTINSYEADTDAITVYTNAEVNADELESAITLVEGGKTVDVSVSKVSTVSKYNTNTQSTAPAYQITKAGGFECGKVYNLSINGLSSNDEAVIMKDAYNKIFKIEEIIADDFSGDSSKWTLAQTNSNSQYHGSNEISIADGKLKVLTGASYSDYHVLVPADYKNMLSLEDYTVEFDCTSVTSGEQFIKFGLTNETMPKINTNDKPRFQVQKGLVREYLKGNGSDWSFTQDSSIAVGEVVNYKFVAKDSRYVLYVNDKKMFDYTTTDNLSAVGVFGIAPLSANAEYYFDNIKFTKVTDLTNITELTINSYEADTDAITVYTSKEVNTEDLKSAITLAESGKAVDVSVSKVSTVSKYNTNTQSTAPAYQITKAGGFECGKVYNLSINGLFSSDETAIMKDAYEKTFKIEEIIADDFSGDSSKWTLAQTNSNSQYHGSNEISIADGKLKVLTGASNSSYHVLVPADYKNMLSLEDYTVEFDCIGVNSCNIKFGLASETPPVIFTNDKPRFQTQDGLVREYLKGNGSDWSFTQDSSIAAGKVVNYKFVAKDSRYVLYVNDKKMFDYTTTDNLSAVGVFGISLYSDNAEYYFDNIKFTKVIDLSNITELTINDYEADTDAITVYTSKEVKTEDLKSAITLFESGKAVDVSVSKVSTVSKYNTNTQSTAPAYQITKAGGFECGKVYNLSINGLFSSDETAIMKDAYKKTFKIEEIIADDFSGDSSKWTLAQTNSNSQYHGSNEISIADGKLKVLTGASYSDYHVLVPADYKNMLSLEDYTVEFDCIGVNSCNIKFGLTNETLPKINTNDKPRFQVQDGLVREYLKGSGSDWSFTQDSSIAVGEVVNYKFVAKDSRYVLYVNDKKMFDYTTTDNLSAVGVFGISLYSDNAEYYFDNIKFTKVTELADEILISDVIINNGTITDVEGQETVDVEVVVQNVYADSKPCEVVVAVYDSANKDMKNAKTFEVKTLTNGVNTFIVEDFAVNGADMIKVFVFDGIGTLKPYCSPIVID